MTVARTIRRAWREFFLRCPECGGPTVLWGFLSGTPICKEQCRVR